MSSAAADDTDLLVDLYEELGPSLHRLAVLLSNEDAARPIVRASVLALGRRFNSIVDPAERVEYLQEQLVHNAHLVRGDGRIMLPRVEDPRHQRILDAISSMPGRHAELLVVSHYLTVFGPDLARILRVTVHSANSRLERSLQVLGQAVGPAGDEPVVGGVESLSQEVTAALRSAAKAVPAPTDEALLEELSTLPDVRSRGLSTWVAVLLVAVSLSLGAWLGASTAPARTVETDPVPTATSPTGPTSPSAPSPTSSASRSLPAQVRSVPVYYVGRGDGLLYRELRDLPAGGSLLNAALEGILRLAPLDPDYDSAWGPGTLIGTQQTGDTLTVDLTPEAYEGITTSQEALRAVDQMVYTATEITGNPNLRLLFLSDGQAPPPILGQPADGFGRHGLEPMPLVWINWPKNGSLLPEGTIVITGNVKPGADPPLVTIRGADGTNVASVIAQTTTTSNAEGWRSWSVSVQLRAGEYVVSAATRDEQGDRVSEETKSITIGG